LLVIRKRPESESGMEQMIDTDTRLRQKPDLPCQIRTLHRARYTVVSSVLNSSDQHPLLRKQKWVHGPPPHTPFTIKIDTVIASSLNASGKCGTTRVAELDPYVL
jgi:hypothetical protein